MAALPHSRALASYLARLRLDDLPAEAVRLLKLCVLDHFGCAIGALGGEVAKIASGIAGAAGGGPCTALGQPARTGPEAAALANGMLSHALIFDDLRGLGCSSADFDFDKELGLEIYFRDLNAIIDHVGVDSVHYCGESFACHE